MESVIQIGKKTASHPSIYESRSTRAPVVAGRCATRSFSGPRRDDQCLERLPIGHHAVRLVFLAGGANGGMKVGKFLRFVLGFVQVADAAEAVDVAVAGLGEEDVIA